jgi:hypothetical protein
MKRTVTALVAAATIAGAAVASSSPAQAWRLGVGVGPWRVCARGRRRQRPILLSIRLLRAISLSAALHVAPGMERLRLGSRLRLTDRSRKPGPGKQLRCFPDGNASDL